MGVREGGWPGGVAWLAWRRVGRTEVARADLWDASVVDWWVDDWVGWVACLGWVADCDCW